MTISYVKPEAGPGYKQVNLWGEVEEPFASAKERLGVWPMTVWPCDMADGELKRLKQAIGDAGQARDGCFSGGAGMYDIGASVFNPVLTAWILSAYGPPPDALVVDPFAGGGTRAIMAAAQGHTYFGTELRQAEADATNARIAAAGYASKAEVICADARQLASYGEGAQFLLTCPPYWSLEKYGGGSADLSMEATYEGFLAGMAEVVGQTAAILRPGALSCWVVGLHRVKGTLYPLHHDITRLHLAAGFALHEEVVLWQKNTQAIQRVGNFFKGGGYLIRCHEYLLVFRAGGATA